MHSKGDRQEANKHITQSKEVSMATKKYKVGKGDGWGRRSYFTWMARDGLPEVTFEQTPQ